MFDERDPALIVVAKPVSELVVVLAANGEIDRDSQAMLDEAGAAALDAGAVRLVVDLTEVTFCDSGGLSLFVRLHRRTEARGGSLRLACAQPAVHRVLRVANFDRLLRVHPTVPEAVAAALAEGSAPAGG